MFCGSKDIKVNETTKSKVNKGGRPRKKIDTDLLLELAKVHCTMAEMAHILHCSVDTLERHHKDIIEQGKAETRQKLRKAQIDSALAGNSVMLIWLGKNMLGQKDQIEEDIKVSLDAREERILEQMAGN